MTKPTPKPITTTPPVVRAPAPGVASTPSLFHEQPTPMRAANQPVHKNPPRSHQRQHLAAGHRQGADV